MYSLAFWRKITRDLLEASRNKGEPRLATWSASENDSECGPNLAAGSGAGQVTRYAMWQLWWDVMSPADACLFPVLPSCPMLPMQNSPSKWQKNFTKYSPATYSIPRLKHHLKSSRQWQANAHWQMKIWRHGPYQRRLSHSGRSVICEWNKDDTS